MTTGASICHNRKVQGGQVHSRKTAHGRRQVIARGPPQATSRPSSLSRRHVPAISKQALSSSARLSNIRLFHISHRKRHLCARYIDTLELLDISTPGSTERTTATQARCQPPTPPRQHAHNRRLLRLHFLRQSTLEHSLGSDRIDRSFAALCTVHLNPNSQWTISQNARPNRSSGGGKAWTPGRPGVVNLATQAIVASIRIAGTL